MGVDPLQAFRAPKVHSDYPMAHPHGSTARERLGNLQHSAVLSFGARGPVAGSDPVLRPCGTDARSNGRAPVTPPRVQQRAATLFCRTPSRLLRQTGKPGRAFARGTCTGVERGPSPQGLLQTPQPEGDHFFRRRGTRQCSVQAWRARRRQGDDS